MADDAESITHELRVYLDQRVEALRAEIRELGDVYRESVSLREHIDALRKEDERARQIGADEREMAAAALREQLTLRIESGDGNLREHITAQIAQIQASLVSADKLEQARIHAVADRTEIVHNASEQAVAKAESSYEKRFEDANEWRAQSADRERSQQQQMADLASTFLPREVAESQMDAINKRGEAQLEAINKRLAVLEAAGQFTEGRQKGVGMSAGVLVTSIGAVLTIITIVIVLANVLTGK